MPDLSSLQADDTLTSIQAHLYLSSVGAAARLTPQEQALILKLLQLSWDLGSDDEVSVVALPIDRRDLTLFRVLQQKADGACVQLHFGEGAEDGEAGMNERDRRVARAIVTGACAAHISSLI